MRRGVTLISVWANRMRQMALNRVVRGGRDLSGHAAKRTRDLSDSAQRSVTYNSDNRYSEPDLNYNGEVI